MSETGDRDGGAQPCRRQFLCVLGAAAGALALGSEGCGGPSTAPFTAGNAADHPVGTFRMFSGNGTIIGRDAAGFYAYSTSCTHQGVALDFSSGTSCSPVAGCSSQSTTGTTTCAAHGSRFDGTGAVIQGPARTALEHFKLTIVGGVLNVDPTAVVAAATRVAV